MTLSRQMRAKNRRDWTAAHEKCREEAHCRGCAGEPVDPAHLVPRSLGGGQKAESVIPLCRECHDLYDSFRLDAIPLTTREEQAEAVRVLGLQRAYDRLRGSALSAEYGEAA